MLIYVIFLVFCVRSSITETSFIKISEIPELAYVNTSVDPCENFYEYTCGNFKNVNPRPENFPLWDSFIIKQEELHVIMEGVLNSKTLDSDPEALQKSKTAYQACMDTNYADKLNYPELKIIKSFGPWPLISDSGDVSEFSWNELGDIVALFGIPLYFSMEVTNDLFNASQLVIMVGRDPVKNPSIVPTNEDNSFGAYTIRNPSIVQPIEDNSVDFLKFKTYEGEVHPFESFLNEIAITLRNGINSKKSEGDIEAEIPNIMKFMSLVQAGGNDNGNFEHIAEFFTIEKLQEWVNKNIGDEINLNVLDYFNRVFAQSGIDLKPTTRVMISSMATFYGTLKLIKDTSNDMLKNFIFSRLFTYTSQDSNNDLRKAYELFRLGMKDRIFTRSEYCTRLVLGYPNGIALSMAATQEYQKYHFNNIKLHSASSMINNLNKAFLNILNEASWLDEPTRENAKLKLNKMITLLGYPDFLDSDDMVNYYYCNVRICAWDHFGNAQRLRAFGSALNYALISKPRNRNVWNRSPLVLNAFYNSQNNRIILPVSMLHSTFYNGKISVVDYGRIGAIIGHEMTHGFDSQGYLYDGDGTLSPWWSQNTTVEFKNREKCFLQQYEKYFIPEINEYVNSKASIRENIADNGGLRESYKAFKELLRHEAALSLRHVTLDQLFFISYGTMWCAQETNEYLENLQRQSYAPSRFRVIGSVSNNEEFAKAFNCPLGSKMNPTEKCVLW